MLRAMLTSKMTKVAKQEIRHERSGELRLKCNNYASTEGEEEPSTSQALFASDPLVQYNLYTEKWRNFQGKQVGGL